MNDRPTTSFDTGLQHERTALAWERTAIAMMVAGLVLSRFVAIHAYWLAAGAGLLQTAFGAGLLLWTGAHYEDLHGPLRAGDDVVHPAAARIVGLVAVSTIGVALVTAIAVAMMR